MEHKLDSAAQISGFPSKDKPWLKYYNKTPTDVYGGEVGKTAFQLMRENCLKFARRTAIEYFGHKISYKKLLIYIEKTADALATFGIKKGDFVSICSLSTPDCIYVFYALSKIGAVANFIEPTTNDERIVSIINSTKSKAVIILDLFLPKFVQLNNQINPEKFIVMSFSKNMGKGKRFLFEFSSYAKAIRKAKKTECGTWLAELINSREEGSAVESLYEHGEAGAVVYTGGTTGVPKGAIISEAAILEFGSQAVFCAPEIFKSRSFLDIMPPFIAYGLMFGFIVPFAAGLKNILVPVFKVQNFPDLLLKYKPNCIIGVPSFFESLLSSRKLKNKKLDFLRCVVAGGDKLLPENEKAINKFLREHGCNHNIDKGYGMTEMGSSATFTVCPECNEIGSVGVPHIHNNIMILAEDGKTELGYNQPGEICMNGPTMTLGYLNNSDETKNLIHVHEDDTAWIHTGDIGYISEAGLVYILDRRKRMIIRPDGHNVWPSVIEKVLISHSAVCECCVIGLPNSTGKSGKIPTAVIKLNKNFPKTNETVKLLDSFCAQFLAERDKPLDYRFVDSIPHTAIGKIDYREVERITHS